MNMYRLVGMVANDNAMLLYDTLADCVDRVARHQAYVANLLLVASTH